MYRDTKNNELGSFLGQVMSQKTKAIWLWELVLRNYNFARIIEFGTWRGGLAAFFQLFCKARGAEFYTFDTRVKWRTPFNLEIGMESSFRQLDIFQNIENIGKIIQQKGVTVLFCDNGKKPREFNTFAPYLKNGDVIAVHDWNSEVFPADVEKACEQYKLKEIFSKESDEEGLTRFFQKYEE